MHWAFYAIPLLGLALLAYFHFQKGKENNHLLVAAPFWVILGFLICFGAFLPQLEEFRPYDELGEALAQSEQVDPKNSGDDRKHPDPQHSLLCQTLCYS